jgi:Tetratricopeptide repeat
VTARPEKGDQYFRSGRYHEAAAAYRIAMDQYTMGLGPDDTLVAEAQANYSNALRRIGRNVEAEFWEQRVDEILRETITGAERNR